MVEITFQISTTTLSLKASNYPFLEGCWGLKYPFEFLWVYCCISERHGAGGPNFLPWRIQGFLQLSLHVPAAVRSPVKMRAPLRALLYTADTLSLCVFLVRVGMVYFADGPIKCCQGNCIYGDANWKEISVRKLVMSVLEKAYGPFEALQGELVRFES